MYLLISKNVREKQYIINIRGAENAVSKTMTTMLKVLVSRISNVRAQKYFSILIFVFNQIKAWKDQILLPAKQVKFRPVTTNLTASSLEVYF